MLYATKHPPIAKAGRNLLLTVAGFGMSILIFGFSKNFLLSLAALALSGVFDGISMVIRRSMVRLLSPDDMRGRISAVSWIFICSSNELGAFESGMVAAWHRSHPLCCRRWCDDFRCGGLDRMDRPATAQTAL